MITDDALFTVDAGEAKNKFGQLMEMAQRHPVGVKRYGRTSTVMLSAEDFAMLKELIVELEDRHWSQRAREAEVEGYCGVEEGRKFLEEMRNA